MQCEVLNLNGLKVKDIELKSNIFNVDFNPILVKEVIEYHQANARQATYGTKNRSQLTYSTKKMRKQKGSGRSRVGPRGAPQHRKGAVAFGPDGRTYDISIPKNKKRKALAMCLTKKLISKEIIFVDDLKMNEIKTKGFVEICKKLNLNNKTLFIDVEKDNNFELSMRNLIGYHFLPLMGINVLNLAKSHKLVITERAIKTLEERYESE